jgi:hypothetical protein
MITPAANGCSGTPITATVIVNPTPIVTATATPNPVCSGGTLSLGTIAELLTCGQSRMDSPAQYKTRLFPTSRPISPVHITLP